jgi:RNA polymerase sigma factor (sigma-70 family)
VTPDETPPDALSLPIEAALLRLGRMVRAAGVRHGLSDAELDALVQEVRVRIWRAHPSSEQIAQLPTSYVYRTAMTAAVDLVRHRRRIQEREPALDVAAPSALVARDQTDAPLLAAELGAAIARELDEMVEARRVVVRMHLAGYERAEIITVLGWTDAKVRNLLYRGLQDLRERLVRVGYRWPEDA